MFRRSNDIILGNGFDSWGSILVSGTGSSLQSSNTLEIGSNGRGSLMVSGGGSVADNYGYIGMLGGSSGNVNISGAGSTWSYSGQTLRGLLRHRFFNYFRGRDGLGSCGWYRYGIGKPRNGLALRCILFVDHEQQPFGRPKWHGDNDDCRRRDGFQLCRLRR